MLPGFWEHYKLYQSFNNFLTIYPFAKRAEAEIYCYYGNFSPCVWDGGRTFSFYSPASLEDMKEVINYYNKILNKKMRLVFTNNLLHEEHLYDQYSNIMLELCNNKNNEIVLNSDILENYIKINFPNYSLISSTTKCLQSQAEKEELNKEQYKFVCLDYNLNHNWKFLNELTPEEKQKTEFLVNPICGPGCPQRAEHYRLNSLFSLSYGTSYKMKYCKISPDSTCGQFNSAIITPDELYTKYFKKDFHYFKLEGRTWNDFEMAICLVEYLIRPEYQSLCLRSLIR